MPGVALDGGPWCVASYYYVVKSSRRAQIFNRRSGLIGRHLRCVLPTTP
jgi:hypothetical protein